MSEHEGDGSPPQSGVEGQATVPHRPTRERRGSMPPTTGSTATNLPGDDAANPRPVFRPLDSDPPSASGEAGPSAGEDAAAVDRVAPRRGRRPRRRPASTAAAVTVEAPLAEEGERQAEDSVESSDEVAGTSMDADSDPLEGSRSGPGSIDINVVVPRGLGRRVNSKLIQQVVQLALRREGWEQPASLDVVIVNDEEMREINATRRGIDEATDVLSFPLLEVRPETGIAEDFFVLPPETQVHLGDVVISFSRVESQADEAGHSHERELAFLTVHAVLHILGYDHDTEDKRRRMRRREEDVLVELGLRRNGS